MKEVSVQNQNSMALRSHENFTRYVFAIQYHGGRFIGFTQHQREYDEIVQNNPSSSVHSIEYFLRSAFNKLIGKGNFENIQISSRTDRGVHALFNTFHVDVRPRTMGDLPWHTKRLHTGTNSYLHRSPYFKKNLIPMQVLAVDKPPLLIPNPFYVEGSDEPKETDWNARFTAYERTYCYQIVNSVHVEGCFSPFDYDRAWRVRIGKKSNVLLDVDSMRQAAKYLIGTHDFTSFRGANCQRTSPITTVTDLQIIESNHCLNNLYCTTATTPVSSFISKPTPVRTIKIKITGNAFLYRHVRNIVGFLVDVGYGKITAECVKSTLLQKNRKIATYAMAPSEGLYLVDVKHNYFEFK